MKRKALAKRILAVMLAILMVNSVIDYNSIWKVMAQDSASRTTEEQQESTESAEDEALESTEEAGTETTETAESTEEAGTETTETAESTEEADTEEKPSDEEKPADEKAGEVANAEGTIAKEAKGILEEVQIKTETAEIDPEILEELPSNEELFDAYVWSVLYDDEVATYGTVARDRLSDTGKKLYDDLKGRISVIAEKGGSTEFALTAGTYSYSTLADLEKEVKAVLQALLSDCPYEFYWYDKTSTGGMSYAYIPTSNSLTNIYFTVAGAYRASDTTNAYVVDFAKATTAANVKTKANNIVATYKGLSDYERLKGYKDEICNLVSYNHAAADKDYKDGYGDPWQLIYVFDENPDTNVVCEGYAKAFQYLCDLDGSLKCYIVTGTMNGGTGAGGHMWNVVALGGNNYIVDVTNCDEGNTTGSYSVGYPDKLFLAGAEENVAGEKYTAQFENFGKMQNVIYAYDTETIGTYSEAELKIASSKYEPKVLTPVTADMITIADGISGSSEYDGKARIVNISINPANYTLTIKKDDEVTSEIKNTGTYTITLTGKNDYSGTVDKTYTITQKTIKPTITGTASKEYDGTKTATRLSISLDGVCDGDVVTATAASYSYDDADAGTDKIVTATGITLTGEDAKNYTLSSASATTTGEITKASANITFKTGEGAYAFENIYNGKALANPAAEQLNLAGVDYSKIQFAWYKGEVGSGTLLAENPTNAGTYYVVLSAPETTNYNSVSITSAPITIAPKEVTSPTIEIKPAGVYDGTAKTPAVTAVKDGDTIIPSEEYTVAYTNNTNAGDATVTLTDNPGGNYIVSGTGTFKIEPENITTLNGKVLLDGQKPGTKNYLYTGKEIEPAVSFEASPLINATDYEVSYTKNKDVGEATVTITGKGNYTGQISANFTIAVGNFTGTISYNGSTKETAKAAYYSSTVQIKTSESDYTISADLEGTYDTTYSFNSENDGSITKTLYFRKTTTGETYKKDVTVNFDKTLPTGTIQIGATIWQELLETITFGRYKVDSLVITITGKDVKSGVAKIEYLISEEQLTADALKTATFTEYTDSSKPSLTKDTNQIVYAKITDKAGNICYISSEGLIIDTIAPNVTDVTVLEDASLKDKEFTVSFKVNEVGTYYYLVKKSGETLPIAEDIINAAKANQNLAGTGKTGTLTEAGKAVITATVTGLAPNSSYIVYVVAQDEVYNIDSLPEKLEPNTSIVVSSKTVTTKKCVPDVTVNPTVSGMYGTAVKYLTITGGEVKAGATVINGTWSITACTNQTLDTLLPVGTTDTCTLTFNPTDSNYAAVTVEAIRPEISKRLVKVKINPASKSYKEENPEFTYTTVAASGIYQDVIAGDDLGISLTTDAGKESEVRSYTIKGTSSNQNYKVTFEGGTGAFSITKAAAIPTVTETKDYVYTVGTGGEVSVNLAEKMSFPDDTGFCKGTVAVTGESSILTAKMEGDTTLKYEVKPLTDSDIGKTAQITVTVSMFNYKNTTYVLNVKIADTKNLNGSVAVDGNKELIYGQALKELALNGTFTDGTGEDAKTVTGKLTWLNPEMKPAVSVTSAEWQFVPDSKEYKTVKGSTPITVVKANPVITEAPTVTGTVTYDPGKKLSDLTLTGGKAEEPIKHTALTGGSFSFVDGSNIVPTADRSEYDVIYTPADTANYNSVNVKVKVIVKKAIPTITTLPTAGGLVYGQSLGNSSLTGGVASVSGKFDWSSKEIRPQIKDSDTTEYEITFVPDDSVNYESVTARVKVHVDKKILSWDTASVNVLNKMEDGSNTANLGGTLKLSGVADGDDIGFSYTGLTAVFADAKAGTDKEVTVTVAGKKLTNENYQLPASDSFVLKGTIEKTKQMEVQPELGSNYSLITGDKGKVEVTRKLAQNPNLDTPEKIVHALQNIVLNKKIDGKAPVKENIEVYDVVLLYTTDGVNWTRADAANFPAGGVNVTLPYPASTNRADYKFLAIHMLADDYMDSNGVMHYAGDVETPELTLKEDGISMTLHSLSPIALSWNKIESNAGTGSSTGTGSTGSGSGTAAGSTTSPAGNVSMTDAKKTEAAAPADEAVKAAEDNTSVEAKSAATGDSKIPAVSGILILFGCFALAAGLRRRRKEM